jgi:hypothetical protein
LTRLFHNFLAVIFVKSKIDAKMFVKQIFLRKFLLKTQIFA